MNDILDLSTSETADEGAWLTIKLNGEPWPNEEEPARIKLAGAESDVMVDFDSKRGAKEINKTFRNGGIHYTAEDIKGEREKSIERASVATLDWENINLGGEDLPCSPANAKKLYSKVQPVLSQVQSFMADESNFMRGSSKNSNGGPTTTSSSKSRTKTE